MICPLVFLLWCILSEPIAIWAYRLLKGIDFSNMSVKKVSERILKFQNIVKKVEMYGTMFFIIYMVIWMSLFCRLSFGPEIIWIIIVFYIIVFLVALISIPILYKLFYYNNINRIKENLRELKEFE
jgi:hypothetical protein